MQGSFNQPQWSVWKTIPMTEWTNQIKSKQQIKANRSGDKLKSTQLIVGRQNQNNASCQVWWWHERVRTDGLHYK